MVEYSGRAYSRFADKVTGRILRADGACEVLENGAKIVVWDGQSEIGETVMKSTVGIVLPEGADITAAQRLACLYRVPTLSLPLSFSEIGERVADKIAILDAEREKLYVNPDLETICSMFGDRHKEVEVSISRLAVSETTPEGFDGVVVTDNLGAEAGEEEIYEYFCDIADRNTGAKIVASVPMHDGEAAFLSHVRAVYRAGVWGRFSILCTGVFTPEHTDRCVSVLHSAFRELDGEGREFDGFMRKGIAIETPIQLLARHRLGAFDFFCLDTAALVRRFCASCDTDKYIFEISEYAESFAKSVGRGTVAVTSEGHMPCALAQRIANLGVPAEIYVEREKYFKNLEKGIDKKSFL